jgi:Flp pilus assembly protein TadG
MHLRWAGLWREQRGGLAVAFALLLPALLLVGAGALELNFVLTDKRVTQDVADRAALMGARQLTINTSGALNQAQAFALAQLGSISSRSNVVVSATQPSAGQVQVAIDTQRASFFMNLLPSGGFHTHVQSTAQAVNSLPLCVLVFGDSGGNNLHMQDSSQMQAGSCLVHSDRDIQVDGQAAIYAADTEAVGKANGTISPAPNMGAAPIEDPFTGVDLTFPSGCSKAPTPPGPGPGNGIGAGPSATVTLDGGTGASPTSGPPGPGGGPAPAPPTPASSLPAGITQSGSTFTVLPGVYCANITVQNGAKVQMSGGEYYFGGNLMVKDTSSIVGDDVAWQFNTNVSLSFDGSSRISLTGRKSGKFAGFVILTTRDNQANFVIQSDHVSQLLGAIYVPNAQLQVLGTGQVAQASAWTVITALSMAVQAAPGAPATQAAPGAQGAGPSKSAGGKSSPTLVINANYSASDVPVPQGVGPGAGGAKLVQ